ncbi:apolipoprotein A-II [Entelurus aequoreus]|uniref:apolipoprotein A-II n=1 Tax=Entelurus aequoreus TaxID=161455 RepID=UPI002B1D87BF|nr:apolipoprotein A-II [Entelurus aequoreus]
MNAKYAVALILALQVSMSLCDAPAPDQDLVDKYDAYKSVFYKRLLNAYSKLQAAVGPIVDKIGESQQGAGAKDFVLDMQNKPELQAFAKVVRGMAEEVTPLVDKARTTLLGLYGHYLRPAVGDLLSDSIDNVKVYLDKFMPAE